MFPPTGEEDSIPFELIARVNQDYEIVGNHLDETVQNCIIKGQYIDFGKLLPKDRILVKEDGHLELTVKNVKTFWSPISEVVSINCFNHWEQAFHIFSNIYTKAHPHRASELIQYNHIIYTISLTYVWDNVYTYDKEFRIHMSCHPERNWLVILQQAWAMHLKDRLMGNRIEHSNWGANQSANMSPNNSTGTGKTKINEPFRKLNKGKCKFGQGCHYEHCCSYCFKFGHGILLSQTRKEVITSRRTITIRHPHMINESKGRSHWV